MFMIVFHRCFYCEKLKRQGLFPCLTNLYWSLSGKIALLAHNCESDVDVPRWDAGGEAALKCCSQNNEWFWLFVGWLLFTLIFLLFCSIERFCVTDGDVASGKPAVHIVCSNALSSVGGEFVWNVS